MSNGAKKDIVLMTGESHLFCKDASEGRDEDITAERDYPDLIADCLL